MSPPLPPDAILPISSFRWNLEEAIEQYRLDPEAVCLAAGLLVPSCHEILDPLDAELRKRPANREKVNFIIVFDVLFFFLFFFFWLHRCCALADSLPQSSPASEPGAAAKGAGSTISETEVHTIVPEM